MGKIFVSYRREDTADVAARLGTRLKDDLRLENVFLDTQDIRAGDSWHDVLDTRLREADAVVVLVGRQWAGSDGQRILESGDVVRWEVRRAIDLACDLVPAMVDGARWPSELPPDIAEITQLSFIDLNLAESRVGYFELLGNLFYKAVRREGDVVVVYDDTDASAEIHLRKLAGMLTSAVLGEDATPLVRAASRGFAAISLGEAAALWPEVVVLRGDQGTTEELEARMRGLRGAGARLRVVPATAAGLLALVVSGRAAQVSPMGAAATPAGWTAPDDALARGARWRGPAAQSASRIPMGAVVLAATVATVAVVGVVTLLPDSSGKQSPGLPSETVAGTFTVFPTTVPSASSGSPTKTVTVTRTVTVQVQVGGTQQAPRTVTSTQRVTDTATRTVTDTAKETVTNTTTQRVTETATETTTVTRQGTTTVTTTRTVTRTVTPKPETVTVTVTTTVYTIG
ncbi:MAG: toll/interleukin-1 receptor domain-containing protein [Kineosporiaceae bacterium]